MPYTFKHIKDNGDATSSYDVIGNFPVEFDAFMREIISSERSFRIDFRSTNECYGGFFGKSFEIHKQRESQEWHFTNNESKEWYDEISSLRVVSAWANGGWGQMTYIVTFEET
jgi:hypothetical protein